ncbi:hypothetical protein ACJX0J_040645, partial [Zea mays]
SLFGLCFVFLFWDDIIICYMFAPQIPFILRRSTWASIRICRSCPQGHYHGMASVLHLHCLVVLV